VRAPTGLERSGMWLRTSFARSDFSNLVSSPATIEVKAGAAAALGSLARRIGQWPNPGSQIIATIPARRFPLRSDADLHVWVASRLDRSSRPDAQRSQAATYGCPARWSTARARTRDLSRPGRITPRRSRS
jgi:hypothetical protein